MADTDAPVSPEPLAERLLEVADSLPHLAWIADPDGRVVWRNRQWSEYTGIAVDELNAGGWRDIRTSAERELAVERWRQAREEGIAYEHITPIRGADGVVRPFLCRAVPMRDAAGRIERWFGTNTEIADLSANERRLTTLAATLAASDERFRAAVAAVQGVVWTNDAAGRMTGEQPGWSALTGQSQAEYEGYGWSAAVHPDDAEPTVVAWNKAVAARGTFVFEHRVRRHDGAWRTFAIRAVPVLEPDGAIREWVGVHTDITEQRAAEAALRAANQEISRTAAIVSHDLRGPLLNVLGFAGEMEAGLAAIARQQAALAAAAPALVDAEAAAAIADQLPEALGFIRAAAQRMDRLVRGILLVSRDGQRRLMPEKVDLADLAAGLGASLARQLDAAGATFEADAAGTVTADRLALEQVLGNLADNAVKYLDPARPGRVRLEARPASGCIRIAVSDNGRGIAPEDHARVFEMFRRAGPQDVAGEGIGLSHVVMLVRRMRGRIELESAPGVGSTFTVTLPN